MNQRLERVDGLHPMLRMPVLTLIERCEQKLKRKLLVVQGWRSTHEQMLNYQKGRALNRETNEWEEVDKALIVTRAKPGRSPHNIITRKGDRASMAVDLVPFAANGSLDWAIGMDFWDDLYELAWKVGLDPLGDPIGSYLAGDLGHFEEPGWKWKIEGLDLLLPVNLVTTPV